MQDGVVHHAHGTGAAMVSKQESARYFDQLSGKEMTAYIQNGELVQVDVSGNAETIFYPHEDDGSFIGMNRTQSSYVQIYFENEQVHHVLFTTETTGTLYPLNQVPAGTDKLSAFFWATKERPLKPGDVFDNPERTPRPAGAPISATDDNEEDKNTNKTKISRSTSTKNKRKQ